jgi:hypothetical protein
MMVLTPFGYMAAFLDACRMANEVAFTVAARGAILAEAAIYPPRALDPEIARMVVEKAAATVEGTVAAQRRLGELALGALRGDDWMALMRKAAAVTEAGLRPARRRVRANARRLAGRR